MLSCKSKPEVFAYQLKEGFPKVVINTCVPRPIVFMWESQGNMQKYCVGQATK